ncbi:MAG: FAD-dependent oxidoreductase, partial [Pseudomonadota bacterium]
GHYGIAGLTCARQLQSQGHAVTVYEKNGVAGGRICTRETEVGGFDHGAQYFTAESEPFQQQIALWRKARVIAPWAGKLVNLIDGKVQAAGRSSQRFVAVPGMSALGLALAVGLDVRLEQRVQRIEQFDGKWLLAVKADTVAIEASAGPFDAVLLALPADHASALLAPLPDLAAQAAKAHLAPCWALMLGFPQALDLGYDGAWIGNSRLAWIAREASKPGRRPGEHWIAHASSAWSAKHLADEPERARDKLIKAFHEATGSQVQPIHAVTYRWPYAQAQKPLAKQCLWDVQSRIGACGDWFAAGLKGSGRIENAFLSGLALAKKLR